MTNAPTEKRITMTPETRAEIEAIAVRLLNHKMYVRAAVDELEAIFARSFAAGVAWMWAGHDEANNALRDHILADFDAETIEAIIKSQEVPHD